LRLDTLIRPLKLDVERLALAPRAYQRVQLSLFPTIFLGLFSEHCRDRLKVFRQYLDAIFSCLFRRATVVAIILIHVKGGRAAVGLQGSDLPLESLVGAAHLGELGGNFVTVAGRIGVGIGSRGTRRRPRSGSASTSAPAATSAAPATVAPTATTSPATAVAAPSLLRFALATDH
jgi:hypothetical protein